VRHFYLDEAVLRHRREQVRAEPSASEYAWTAATAIRYSSASWEHIYMALDTNRRRSKSSHVMHDAGLESLSCHGHVSADEDDKHFLSVRHE
jgi:hypothetical protein